MEKRNHNRKLLAHSSRMINLILFLERVNNLSSCDTKLVYVAPKLELFNILSPDLNFHSPREAKYVRESRKTNIKKKNFAARILSGCFFSST